jgi:hypothetical protein
MSAQTGIAPPDGPASTRFVDRARYRAKRLQDDPNPIWIRELKQSARLARTPVILMVVTILMTLLMAAIGAGFATSTSPADIGIGLYHTFFSVAFFVVTWVGPAVAANSIASERDGRTWEAVILTGLRPEVVARGKFLAAYTSIGLYIVMLAPVGALPFLFGGVTATEVVVAFLFLFLVALLSVAFGLAISSKMSSNRIAIVLTLLMSVPLSMLIFGVVGVGLSFAAHDAWPAVLEGPPVWLPTAYARVPFGLSYLVFLVVLPTASVVLPAWFLYEVTIANLATASDDQSSGIRRWYLGAAGIVIASVVLPLLATGSADHDDVAVLGAVALACHLLFCTFVLAGEPLGPSRRVSERWRREGKGRLRRFLGPGILQASMLELLVGALGFVAIVAVMIAVAKIAGTPPALFGEQVATTVAVVGYIAAFYFFAVGFAAWARVRSSSPTAARVLLLAVLSGAAILPWIVAVMAGAMSSTSGAWLVAAPSPFYAIKMANEISLGGDPSVLWAGAICALSWAARGGLLFLLGASKCRRLIADRERAMADADQKFAEEREAERLAALGADQSAVDSSSSMVGGGV